MVVDARILGASLRLGHRAVLMLVLGLCLLGSACGQKGPLVLPPDAATANSPAKTR